METLEAIRFNITKENEVNQMLAHLNQEGYVVIADAIPSQEEIERFKDLFWNYIETTSNQTITRDDPISWNDVNGWPGNKSTGIISSPSFNHSSFMWNLRLLPRVKEAFSHIWKTNDLLVSFDAGNAFRPWKHNSQWVTEGSWWHVDQNALRGPSRQGRVCVQGLVSLYDATSETGGLCVIPRSHLIHQDICERSPSAKLMTDYVHISANDPLISSLSSGKDLSPVVVGCKAGDLILWDSRLIHCNSPSSQAPSKASSCSSSAAAVLPSEMDSRTMKPPSIMKDASMDGTLMKGRLERKAGSKDDEEDEILCGGLIPEKGKANRNGVVEDDYEFINEDDTYDVMMYSLESTPRSPTSAPSPRSPRIRTANPIKAVADDNVEELNNSALQAVQDVNLVCESPVKSSSVSSVPLTNRGSCFDLIRLVGYVCMLPKSLASPAVIRSRKNGYLYQVPTSHWPTQLIDLPFQAPTKVSSPLRSRRSYSRRRKSTKKAFRNSDTIIMGERDFFDEDSEEEEKDSQISWKNVPVEQMKLIGFSNWEIQLKKFRLTDFCRGFYVRVVSHRSPASPPSSPVRTSSSPPSPASIALMKDNAILA
jgi:ectoine hydroxylase-related dioxygenase (phytanoyl-CoA dioxygenase family)